MPARSSTMLSVFSLSLVALAAPDARAGSVSQSHHFGNFDLTQYTNTSSPEFPISFRLDGMDDIQSYLLLDNDLFAAAITVDPGDWLVATSSASIFMQCNSSLATIMNYGGIRLYGSHSPAQLALQHCSTLLSGGGSVLLNGETGGILRGAHPADVLVNLDNYIHGFGSLGANSLGFNNYGEFNANIPFQSLVIDPSAIGFHNNGLVRASNQGRLTLRDGTFTNYASASIEAFDASIIDLDGATIRNGRLASDSLSLIRAYAAPSTIENITNDGNFDLGPVRLTLKGDITNNGAFNAVANFSITDGPIISELLMPGPGDLRLLGSGALTCFSSIISSGTGAPGARLVNGPQHTIRGNVIIGLNSVGLWNLGTIIADQESPISIDSPNSLNVVNDGLMRAQGLQGFLILDSTFQNNGVVEILDGSKFTSFGSSVIANNTSPVFLGGTWRVLAGNSNTKLELNGPNVLVNAADVTMSGSHAYCSRMNNINFNTGSLSLLNGKIQSASPSFDNAGLLTLDTRSSLTVDGPFTQDPFATLHIVIADPAAAAAATGLIVNGPATLAGSLHVSLAPGAQFSPGQQINILSATSITGAFADVQLPSGASMSVQGGQIVFSPSPACAGDLNADSAVSIDDLTVLILQWGDCVGCSADFNSDGAVNIDDLTSLVQRWGPCSTSTTSE